MMRWIGILKFHGLYLWCGHSFNGWCCSRVWYIQTRHGSKRLIFSGLFCPSNLRRATEPSYENPTIQTNNEYLRGDMETGITCREAFSAAERDPPCTPGPLITLQPDSIARQAPPGHSTVWYWATHRTRDSYGAGLRSWLPALCFTAFQSGQVYQSPHLWL